MPRKKRPVSAKELQILICCKGRLMPFYVAKKMSNKLLKMCGESGGCGGEMGEFFGLMIDEARSALDYEKRQEAGEDSDDFIAWGIKLVPMQETEGHVLYKLVDDPLGD